MEGGDEGPRLLHQVPRRVTVAEAVKAGVPRGSVAWDVAHGFITLKTEG